MTGLVDTQLLIWYGLGSPKLSSFHRAWMENQANDLVLSVATVWEMAVKVGKGKLDLNGMSASAFSERVADALSMRVLPISLAHVQAVATLPQHHGDPFDRILIAQARSEGFAILTVDSAIKQYSIPAI